MIISGTEQPVAMGAKKGHSAAFGSWWEATQTSAVDGA
jgi:hypothetical protein